MKGSAYYYKQMADISSKQDKLAKKESLYQRYVEKLISLYNKAGNVSDDIDYAFKLLATGGYSVDGNIPHHDEFVSGTKSLYGALDTLAKVINDTTKDIADISRKMRSLDNKFNTAKKNYKEALKRENS